MENKVNEVIQAVEYRTKNYIFSFKEFAEVYKHINDDEYQVGTIHDLNGKEILPIIYYSDCYNLYGGHCKTMYDSIPDKYFICISKYFIDNWYCLYNKLQFKLLVCCMLHELGHFMNGDLEKDVDVNQYNKERMRCLILGTVTSEEYKADKFAADEMGQDLMISSLDKMIRIRKKRNDKGMNSAIKEVELRKIALKDGKI